MSNAIGNTKDLDTSRKEVLQGLLSSLGHTNGDPSSGARLSTEQLRKLSEKINEILGDGADHGRTVGDQPSQFLNEDGLPIIEISEPVNGDSQTSTSPPSVPEQDLIPFSLLHPDEKERRRRDRDRILDLLEEEERLQQVQEERDAEEERKEAIKKRKESARTELDRLKTAHELQKKMGQALVSNAKSKGENEHGIPVVSTAEAQKYPMNMHVVERRPTATPASPSHDDADSDDESTYSAGHPLPHNGNDSSDEEVRPSSGDNNLSDDEPLEEGFDYDTAQHHREIALEYHKKRRAIGAETAKVMTAHTLDDYEQHETSNGQFPLSRFRADRMAAAYDKSHGPVSTSIGPTVIPTSRQKSLRNSVRLGKLENDRLVGGDYGESGSEDETIREVIQMLQTGSIQNAGPDFKPSSMSTIAPPKNSDAVESPMVGMSAAARGAKPSRFKLARGGVTTFQGNNSRDSVRSQPAISSVVERKAPRSSPSQHFPINKPPPRPPVKASEPAGDTSTVIIPSSSHARPMTIGSPSLHQTQPERPSLAESSETQDSMIQSRVSPGDPSSVERAISKFMAERKEISS